MQNIGMYGLNMGPTSYVNHRFYCVNTSMEYNDSSRTAFRTVPDPGATELGRKATADELRRVKGRERQIQTRQMKAASDTLAQEVRAERALRRKCGVPAAHLNPGWRFKK
jgi:hypothetical protein